MKKQVPARSEIDRWLRLERYAVFRQHRFPLLRLPEDVLEQHVVRILDDEDAMSLIEAIVGHLPCAHKYADVHRCPAPLRRAWFRAACQHSPRAFFTGPIPNSAFFHAHDCLEVVAVLDWSVFCPPGAKPTPVATFRWENMNSSIVIHGKELHRAVRHAVRHHTPELRVTLHRASYRFSPRFERIVDPHPLSASTYAAFPLELFMATRSLIPDRCRSHRPLDLSLYPLEFAKLSAPQEQHSRILRSLHPLTVRQPQLDL